MFDNQEMKYKDWLIQEYENNKQNATLKVEIKFFPNISKLDILYIFNLGYMMDYEL